MIELRERYLELLEEEKNGKANSENSKILKTDIETREIISSLRISGYKVKADTFADIMKYREQFEKAGIRSFVSEVEGLDVTSVADPIDEIWNFCKNLYNPKWFA